MPHPGYTVPHSSDDDAPLRLLETHPAFARASERIAEHTAPPARRKPLRHPDQALLSTARAADLPRLREALRAGANVNAVETTSRSIGIHGRAQGPRRSALQLALMARGRTWVDCAHALITAGSDPLYSNRWGETPPELVRDARVTLGEDRMVKDEHALASLRAAIEISGHGHRAAMAALRPGVGEHQIEALLEYEFRRRGADGPAYGTIVGGGDNACILHYVDNDDVLRDGELMLVDAGAEVDLFAGDITRTSPIGGRFSAAQRDLYDIVLAANRTGIARAEVGSDIDTIHRACLRVLCEGLAGLGLLPEGVDAALEQELYKRYYPHRTSHWLGADVHDAGHYTLQRTPRPLQPGFVLTIEPGLYIPATDDRAPAGLRGVGIRIEDDVLVRDGGPEVLTASVPKDPAAIEALVGQSPLP